MNDDGTIDKVMKKRLDGALKAIEKFNIDKILCTGGFGLYTKTPICEADAMEAYLLAHGVSKDMIVKENESRTTEENMMNSSVILHNIKATQVILLTSWYHHARPYLNPVCLYKKFVKDIPVKALGV